MVGSSIQPKERTGLAAVKNAAHQFDRLIGAWKAPRALSDQICPKIETLTHLRSVVICGMIEQSRLAQDGWMKHHGRIDYPLG